MDTDGRRPGQGRYSHPEREQRWVVATLPSDAELNSVIVDRYIAGTSLRLRRVDSGGDIVHKFGQKVRPDPTDPELVQLTNIYLSAAEYEVLSDLPASTVTKLRHSTSWLDRRIVIDEFTGRHAGLVLAEVELDLGEPLLPPPPFARQDVTHDDRYSGGSLAHASEEALALLLQKSRSKG